MTCPHCHGTRLVSIVKFTPRGKFNYQTDCGYCQGRGTCTPPWAKHYERQGRRVCPECYGDGEVEVVHPSGDPQLSTIRSCGRCAGVGYAGAA